MTVATTGTAPVQGELWSARADDWASVHEPNMTPAYEVVLDLVHAGPGVEILEVGCGSGTALRLAADRGAHVTALDAAPAFVEVRAPPRARGPTSASVTSSSCPTRTSRSTSSWASTRSSTPPTRWPRSPRPVAFCAPAASCPRSCGARPRSASSRRTCRRSAR